ncbi:hypothetical protein ABBQ38_001571 [Trebouxia sp. C0009 RCD-2024]
MAASRTFASKLGAFWSSPTGPQTTHFWGPVANWGFVIAGVADTQKDASLLSPNMTGAMCVYSALFMRFALAIKPRNYLLFACHAANETVQLYNLQRWQRHAKGWSVSDRDADTHTPTGLPRTRIVVLGSGWGAISLLRNLDPKLTSAAGPYDVTLVSPRNYFLYTPLLPSAATGTVEPRSIVDPVRSHIPDTGNYLEAECVDVDPVGKTILCQYSKPFKGQDGEYTGRQFNVPYDVLVVAVGSVTNTFNVPGVEENCFFLKDMEGAKALRQRINECFEISALPSTTPEERKRLLTFVVVGGGPTGVELAAEMHDYIKEDLSVHFPSLKDIVRVRLVDTHDHILNTYDRQIAIYATEQFQRQGIELVMNCRVNEVQPGQVVVTDAPTKEKKNVEFGTCIWTTGIKMHPLVVKLAKTLPQGIQEHWKSLKTDQFLQVQGTGGSILALGDAATVSQDTALNHAEQLFAEGDVNGDGTLNCEEVIALMLKARKRFPMLAEFAARMNCGGTDVSATASFMRQMMHSVTRPSYDNVIATQTFGDEEDEEEVTEDKPVASSSGGAPTEEPAMTLEQFKEQLTELNKDLRSLPATAQVATQQGKYLAKVLKDSPVILREGPNGPTVTGLPLDASPFKYKHLGSLAYIGADKAVMDPAHKDSPVGAIRGWLMGFAWKGAETFMQISVKNMYLVSRDLVKTKVFGRDVSDV